MSETSTGRFWVLTLFQHAYFEAFGEATCLTSLSAPFSDLALVRCWTAVFNVTLEEEQKTSTFYRLQQPLIWYQCRKKKIFLTMWSDLTLDGSLKECFAGLARCYTVVVAWRHIPTHQTQPLGQRAQRVLAAARSISSGALFRPIATFVFEVAAQGWRVQWRGVSFNAVSSGSPALRGIRRGPTGAGSTSPASFGAAGFCLYVDIWPTLPGRHDSWGGRDTTKKCQSQ